METAPVLIHIFNRPSLVPNLIEVVRMAKPKKLFISADGAREDKLGEKELCDESRKRILELVDWPCDVQTLFQESNLGTRYALIAGITWFFDQVEEGIILEEDCLPNESFFKFCTTLLEYHRHDPRIMHITGTNQQFGKKVGDASYYYSCFPSIWGWASWRRVWKLYDPKMSLFPELDKENMLLNVFSDPVIVEDLQIALRMTYDDQNMTWDHQLGFAIAINNGLCIVPNVNLVSNVGVKKIGPQQLDSVVSNIPTVELDVNNIVHPDFYIANRAADLNQITWSYEDTTTTNKTKFKYEQYNKKSSFLNKLKSKFLEA
ncbi:MAG: nucleotide-diphospho-sugar transferase [Pyrinomonadaceae bacterium]|nr:nucleotide-diphospho-sugar transferase [Sphingobacteriaceae bacterium]